MASSQSCSPEVAAYLDVLSVHRRYSVNTVKAVARDLACIPGDSPSQASVQVLKTVLVQRHAAGAAPSSLARLVSSWRGFYADLVQRGVIANNPALGLKTPKKPKRLPKAVSVDQVCALLDGPLPTCPPAPFGHVIAHVLIELLYATGLRISEALSLQLTHAAATQAKTIRDDLQDGHLQDGLQHTSSLGWISLSRQELQVHGKGNKTRIVPLTTVVVSVLEQWLVFRAQWLQQKGLSAEFVHDLFVSSTGRSYSVRQAQKDVAAYAAHRGLSRHLHPHMLRHSFGSHVLQGSRNLRAVQELLGHASIVSTQVYTALDFQHLAQVYDQAFPRAKKED